MSINTTEYRQQYVGNGATTAFSFPYLFLDNSHLRATRTEIATGIDTLLVLTTDYTITGANQPNGGTVTLNVAPTSGQRITIERIVPLTQLIDYKRADKFPADTHEGALDKLTMALQQVGAGGATLDRALRYRATEPAGFTAELPDKDSRKNKIIGFDANGNLQVAQGLGQWRGTWGSGTVYQVRDLFADPATDNLYITRQLHTATSIAADLLSDYIELVLDVSSVSASAAAASTSATNAATSAINAASSASAALTSATNAASSASAASTSASTATIAASQALQYRNEAATYPIPSWVSGIFYSVDRTVIESNKLYRCITAHTSSALFISDAANWVQLGDNGIVLSTTRETITQIAHSFVSGDVLTKSGANYIKANANTFSTSIIYGIVESVTDADHFILVSAGFISGLSGLTNGSLYYLSASVAGTLTTTAPNNPFYQIPALLATSATAGIVISFSSLTPAVGTIDSSKLTNTFISSLSETITIDSANDLLMIHDASQADPKFRKVTPANLFTAFTSPITTGTLTDYVGSTVPSGWVFADGKTIGNASSLATGRASVDTQALFELLWGSMANTEAPVSGGRGVSAAADFNANKTIQLPDLRGRVAVGKDNMGGTDAGRMTTAGSGLDGDTLGKSGGAETHTLTIGQMPSHNHSLSQSIHYGVGVTNDGLTATTASSNAISINNTGSGQVHNNTQPSFILNKIIKL